MGDRTLLRQAVTNLVDNAVKYTPSGGEVTVGLDVTEDTATVRVTDTGIGIAPPDQSRLFEMFYRIKRREAGSTQGTGLGLALVKSIVERHGGSSSSSCPCLTTASPDATRNASPASLTAP